MATIDRHHENRVFSEFNQVGVFDRNFNILWCENERLFHRIAVAHKRLESKIISADNGKTAVHFFLYDGRYHRAKINALSDGTYLFRVAKEIEKEELEMDELFDYLDEISHNCLDILTMTDILEEYLNRSKYISDAFHENVDVQKRKTLEIYNYCRNMLEVFNRESNSEFIPLQKYLIRTLDIVQHVIRRLPKKIALYSDLTFPATKVDYSKLELALYNLIKFALIYSTGNKDLLLSVRRITIKEIEVEMSFRVNSEFSFANCRLEMHTIKHLFRKLNGHFEFYEEDNMMHARGLFEAEFSLNADDIAPGRDIEFIDDPELLDRKKNSDKYIKIYRNVSDKGNMLASGAVDFSDVEDDDVRFAERFFGDVVIKE